MNGYGLYLFVMLKGKYLRFCYRYEKNVNYFALEIYPENSLEGARDAHYHARKRLREGLDLNLQKTTKGIKVNKCRKFI